MLYQLSYSTIRLLETDYRLPQEAVFVYSNNISQYDWRFLIPVSQQV